MRSAMPSRTAPRSTTAGFTHGLGTRHYPGAVRLRQQPRHRGRARPQVAPRAASTDATTDAGAASTDSQVNCRIYSSEGFKTQLEAQLSFVGPDNRQVGATVDLSKFTSRKWLRPNPNGVEPAIVELGVIYEGKVEVPSYATADFLVLRVLPGVAGSSEYINKIEIENKQTNGTGGWNIVVTPNTWIHESHGSRLFSARSQAYLPSETPEHLVAFREADLAAIKGTPLQQISQRSDWDRVYDYDVYNDLAGFEALPKGSPPDTPRRLQDRAVLGGSAKYPYPRRLRTGRSLIPGPTGELTYETRDTTTGNFWVPLDERFNAVKDSNFKSYSFFALVPALAQGIRRRFLDSDGMLTDFKEVDRMYSALEDDSFNVGPLELLDALNTREGRLRSNARKQLGVDLKDIQIPRLPGPLGVLTGVLLGTFSSSYRSLKKLSERGKTLLKFPEPMVQHGRKGIWQDDAEFGRQALAGVNPSCVRAVTSSTPLGTIADALAGTDLLGGFSMDNLRSLGESKPRLLVIDHTQVFEDYAERISRQESLDSNKDDKETADRYGYSGRCLLIQDGDGQWRPVAIQLQGWDDKTPTIYTPKNDPNVWRLAKGVFLSLDVGFHQLITHWLRCHACTEPYIIATHRCLSSLHPVYKLMVPHWRFTMNINANARQNLINAKGVIETGFTPGRYAMEMSSVVYGALWEFNKQGLPADLKERGLAKEGADGKLELLLDDYPYADDGMLIWDALHEWVGQYLRLYYDDSDPKKSVTGDSEIMAWWHEIVTKGHADKKTGWPDLKTVGDLTEILTTMIWVASGHHAAINFSQYGYTGYLLNRPAVCTKPIPKKGTPEYERLVSSEAAGEKVFLETLHNSGTEGTVLTVELLSTHADNEVYLGDPDHPYILDEPALKAYKKFVTKIKAAEEEMEKRNKDPERKVRQGLAYEFLMPTSGPGITSRGVPQSVSI